MVKYSALAVASALVCSTLQGCTILRSQWADPRLAEQRDGMTYMLPKSLLPVELVINGASVRLDIKAPEVMGDADYQYVLKQPTQPFRSDNVVVEVDPKTSLLKSVKITAIDKTADIIKKIASTVARPESGESGDFVLYRALIDPANSVQVAKENQAMNKALATHLGRLTERCPQDIALAAEKDKTAGTKTAEIAERERCRGLEVLHRTHQPATPDRTLAANATQVTVESPTDAEIGISIGEPAGLLPAGTKAAGSNASCPDGICHRATMPFTIRAHVLGTTAATVAYLPNRAPVMSLSMPAHALVTTTYDVQLTEGSLSKMTRDVPSTALAVVSLPLDVVTAVVDTVNDLIQLKIDTSGKEKALADAKVAELNAEAALATLLAQRAAQSGQESGAAPGVSSKGILLSAMVGQRSSALTSVATPGQSPIPLQPDTGSSDGKLPPVLPLPAMPVASAPKK